MCAHLSKSDIPFNQTLSSLHHYYLNPSEASLELGNEICSYKTQPNLQKESLLVSLFTFWLKIFTMGCIFLKIE